MTLLAGRAGWLSALPWWCALALTAALAVALPPTWRAWRQPPIRSAGWAADGGWTLRDAHCADTPATLLSSRLYNAGINPHRAGVVITGAAAFVHGIPPPPSCRRRRQ